jgi:5-methylcytosine-specific restriction protein B
MIANQPIAYLLGAYWYDKDPENQLPRFLKEGIWENGYEDKYLKLVQEIPVGAPVLIKASYYHNGLKQPVLSVRARGIVTANAGNGRHLSVDWEPNFQQYQIPQSELPGIGRYRDTVEKVTESSHLARLLGGQATQVVTASIKSSQPLNQILYGPPGTGKTHHTKARAVGIIEDLTDEEVAETYDREGIRARFEEHRKAGQIEFVTFHQAFGYEDFVEGIKPNLTADDDLQYRIEVGLFRRMATAAYTNWHRATTPADAPAEPAELDFSLVYGSYLADLQARLAASPDHTVTVLTVGGYPAVISAASDTGIISIRHGSAPLQYNVRAAWTRAVYQQYAQATDIVPVIQKMLEIGGPNASLQWAIFNDLKQYEATHLPELRAQMAAEAGPAPTASGTADKYVLIIDEINRGNVANIFGELITLLEDDKRAGRPEALTVKLPYSKEDFTVPENLYLLGTMNTADRSVEALDTALRRRFSFTEMLPEPRVIRDKVGANGMLGEGPDAVDVARLLEVLNSRLEQLLDRDHCLGHALLLGIGTLNELRAAFQRNIVPLLQEYFFGDWGKIGLVLGTRFVAVAKANAPGRVALAAFPGYDGASQHNRPLYRLTPPESWDAVAFQSIYSAAAAA